jgi:heptosyltransferase-3
MARNVYGKYQDLTGVKGVLVVIFKNIGDVLLASPVFGALKRAMPGAKVDALVNHGTEEMLEGNPNIDRILVLDRARLGRGLYARAAEELRVLREVRAARYDMVVVLCTGRRGRKMALFSGAGIRVGPRTKQTTFLGRQLLTVPVAMAPARRHYVERNLDCLRRIGIFPGPDKRHTVFFDSPEAASRGRDLLSTAGVEDGAPYIVAHPTSRWMFKCWPLEKTAELIDRVSRELGVRVVLTSGPGGSEKAYVEALKGRLSTDIVDLTGILSLKELGAVIRGARLFFGVDSAPMHMAAAVGTPVVAIFGPSIVDDWAPVGDGHTVITSGRHSCVPCGMDGCGGSKVSDCIVSIEVSTVFEAIARRLAELSPVAVQ